MRITTTIDTGNKSSKYILKFYILKYFEKHSDTILPVMCITTTMDTGNKSLENISKNYILNVILEIHSEF